VPQWWIRLEWEPVWPKFGPYVQEEGRWTCRQILVAAVNQSVRAMDAGMSGPDALQLLLRAVCG
ncbi:unnamed protein product, partial [Ectocarpus sp. 4 AP-2014]